MTLKVQFFFIISLLAASMELIGQPGTWTWMRGDSVSNNMGYFGAKGISSPINNPPASYESAEFKDQQGNFWLFGGLNNMYVPYNDLWKYNPAINQWTWMKGTSIGGAGSFGVLGVPALSNNPPGLSWGVTSWVDNNGDFWIFGGLGDNGFSNDLWKYNIASNMWTWMKGNGTSGPPIYGVQGIPSATNTPGSRCESNAAWVDNNNNLWLFGGTEVFDMNDLWKYDPVINQWTWMKGANFSGQAATYGTKGIPNPANVPGAREVHCHWKDSIGDFWFFGGYNILLGFYNDMWKYSPSTNNWTWMSGSNQPGGISIYGTQCIPSVYNVPSARFENRSFWTDTSGNFWLYGGGGIDTSATLVSDLWMFNPYTLKWTFVSGDTLTNQPAIFGSLGLPSQNNKPGGRMGSIGWYDNAGYLFLFGGNSEIINFTTFNDIWRYEIDPNCPSDGTLAPSVNFICSDTTFCEKQCIDFTDISTNSPTSWQWFFPGADSTSSTLQHPTNICYNSYGSFDVTLIACNAIGCDTLSIPNFINEFQPPPIPIITLNYDTLFSTPAYAYQWYNSNGVIPGAVNQYYVFQQVDNYYVIVSDSNGCAVSSNVIYTAVEETYDVSQGLYVIPNPNGGSFEVLIPGNTDELEFCLIYDITGRIVFKSTYLRGTKFKIDIQEASSGIYLMRIKAGNKIWNKKIVLHH